MSSNPPPDPPSTPPKGGTGRTAADGTSAEPPATVARTRSRRPMTLRTKLIVGFGALIIAVCAVVGVVTEVALSNYLVDKLDSQLASTGQRFRGPDGDRPALAVAGDSGGGAGNSAGGTFDAATADAITAGCTAQTGPFGRQQDNSIFAIAKNGTIVGAVLRRNFGSCTVLTPAQAAPLLGLAVGDRPVTIALGNFGDFRTQATAGLYGETLITALPMAPVTDTQVRLAAIMAAVMGGALLAGGGAVFWIVRRSVRPLERVAATARQVATLPLHRGEVDLSVRVPERDTDTRTEIGQVGSALNQMLGHVSSALKSRQESETRVRQFVADASHELRTPLAAIRGYAELARRGEFDPAAIAHALGRVESESSRMTTLVEDLLLLARLDSGRPLATEEVDVTMLLMDRVSDARVAGPDHRWQLDLPDEPLVVTGDGARLHQVVANLLANARTHTPPGTTVVAGLRADAEGVVITVTDDGPGIPEALAPEIFTRFVRGDSSRSRAAGSTGLGLAIVAAVISAHAGTVTVGSRPGRTQARVWLPRNGSEVSNESLEITGTTQPAGRERNADQPPVDVTTGG